MKTFNKNGTINSGLELYDADGCLMTWNPFNNEAGNYNIAVIGDSSSERSIFIKELILSIQRMNGRIFILDDGRNYADFVRKHGGEVIEFSDQSRLCINPFSIMDEGEMKKNPMYEWRVVSVICSMIRQMCESAKKSGQLVTRAQEIQIAHVVHDILKNHGKSGSISMVRDMMVEHSDDQIKKLATYINPFSIGGNYSHFFEGQHNIKLLNPLTIFELSGLNYYKEIQPLLEMLILNIVEESIYSGDRKFPTSIVMEGSSQLFQGGAAYSILEGVARSVRPLYGNIIIGTQKNCHQVITNTNILRNIDWLVLLDQSQQSLEKLIQIKNYSGLDVVKELLTKVPPKNNQYLSAIIHGPVDNRICRLINSEPVLIGEPSLEKEHNRRFIESLESRAKKHQGNSIIVESAINKDYPRKFLDKIRGIRSEFLMAAAIALVVSVLSSAITYQITMRKVPKIAVVDLVYLNNDFSLKLARYLADHEVAEEQMTEAVKTYIANLETLLKDINKSGNYILLQKQTVVSEGVPDITKDLEKVLFETVVSQTKFVADRPQESLLDRFQNKPTDDLKEESLPNLR